MPTTIVRSQRFHLALYSFSVLGPSNHASFAPGLRVRWQARPPIVLGKHSGAGSRTQTSACAAAGTEAARPNPNRTETLSRSARRGGLDIIAKSS